MEAVHYETRESLIGHLAQELNRGTLTLVLGAGVSVAYGLPNWDTLVARLCQIMKHRRRAGESNEALAEAIRTEKCGGDRARFAESVRKALFYEFDMSMVELRRKDLLAAIGALTLVAQRGSVRSVISFNFDDLLERYLRYHGMSVEAVSDVPAWHTRCDLTVLHPHGLLTSDVSVAPVGRFVFTEADYDELFDATAKSLWEAKIVEILSSNTCMFIGLSGADQNVRALIGTGNKVHVNRGVEPFWGVSFKVAGHASNAVWGRNRIFEHELSSYEDLPSFLFAICQRASEFRPVMCAPSTSSEVSLGGGPAAKKRRARS